MKPKRAVSKMSPDGADLHVPGSGYKLKKKRKVLKKKK